MLPRSKVSTNLRITCTLDAHALGRPRVVTGRGAWVELADDLIFAPIGLGVGRDLCAGWGSSHPHHDTLLHREQGHCPVNLTPARFYDGAGPDPAIDARPGWSMSVRAAGTGASSIFPPAA